MGFYSDVYSSPENHGLKIIAMLDEAGLCYEFNMFGVWVDDKGNLYYGADMGCSCPSPFENTSIEGLTKASKGVIMDEAKFWGATAEQVMELFDVLDAQPGTWQR